jgi:hypothetical protein
MAYCKAKLKSNGDRVPTRLRAFLTASVFNKRSSFRILVVTDNAPTVCRSCKVPSLLNRNHRQTIINNHRIKHVLIDRVLSQHYSTTRVFPSKNVPDEILKNVFVCISDSYNSFYVSCLPLTRNPQLKITVPSHKSC